MSETGPPVDPGAETEIQTHAEGPGASTPALTPAGSSDDFGVLAPGRSPSTDAFAPTEVDLDSPGPVRRRRHEVPDWVEGYRIERELARGGMGVVYVAEDPRLERRVALKVLRGAALAGPGELERFAIEAKAAAKLRHPNVVAVHAFGETEAGIPYLVMDLIDGESLAARLEREGPLPPREAARLCKGVAEALAAAHAAGILHRDLKPANVLVDADGEPRLTDFGLAKRVESEDAATITGQVLGTPSYMSPEQAAGEGEVEVRSDVYGLGATLFHLLTGRPPFQGNNAWKVLSAVLLEEPPAPRELRPELDLSIEAVCVRCLERAPDARYPNAAALAADLGRYLANEEVEARPLTPGRKAWRALVRYRAHLTLAAFVLCLVLGGVGLAVVSRRERAPWERLERARELLRAGRAADEVAGEVEAALRLGGERERVQLEAARVLGEAGLEARARALLEEAVRDHPPGVHALLELHRLEVGAGPAQATPALARLLKAARASGHDDAYARYAQGAELLERQPEAALTQLTAAIAQAPRFAWARLARAAAYDRLGRADAALKDLEVALDAEPRLVSARLLRGRLHAEAGRYEQARRDLREAERQAPRSGWASYRLGLLELRLERLGPADASLRRAAERFAAASATEGRALALGARAVVALEEGRAAEAKELAQEAVGLAERQASKAHLVLAQLAVAAGDDAGALPHLNGALRADPNLVPALIERGRLRGDLKDLDRAVHLAPRSVEARRERAFVRAQQRRFDEARADLDAALAVSPGDAKAYDMRADVAQLAGDRAAAERDYGNAITADGRWPDPRIKRGILRAKLGRPQEAAADWAAALKLMPADHPRRPTVEAWLRRVRGSSE